MILGSVQTSNSSVKKKSVPKIKSFDGLDGLKQDAANMYAYLRKHKNTYLGQYEIGIQNDSKDMLINQIKQIL